eukprot:sb/3472086/
MLALVTLSLLILLPISTTSQALGNDPPWNNWMYRKRSAALHTVLRSTNESEALFVDEDQEDPVEPATKSTPSALLADGDDWDEIIDSGGEWAKLVLIKETGRRRSLRRTRANLNLTDVTGMQVYCGRWEVCSSTCILVDSKCPCMRDKKLLKSATPTSVFSVKLLEKYVNCF